MSAPRQPLRLRLVDGIESVIGTLSPRWAAERAMSRAAIRAAERLAYRSASNRRTERETPPRARQADLDLELGRDRSAVVSRMRQLEQDSALAFGMLRATRENTVGSGFGLDPETGDEAWNKAALDLWTGWTRDPEARGLFSWDELLGLLFVSYLRDGDVGLVLLEDGKVQAIESDLISSPYGNQGRNLVDGVELDERGRPSKYFVLVEDFKSASRIVTRGKYKEIPAESMIFLARRTRLGQTRGLPAFAQIAWLFDQMDGFIEATTVAARMSACFGLVFQTKTKRAGLATETDGDGNARRRMRVEPGQIYELEVGEDIKGVQGAQPVTGFTDFLATLSRVSGLVLGLPLEIALLDFSRTNYSSARASLLQAHQTWACHQANLRILCSRVYLWKVAEWIDAGLLAPRGDADAHRWMCPGWRWVDPEKEVAAAIAAMDANLDTHAATAMRMGREPRGLLKARAKELDEMEKLKLPLVRSNTTRDPGAPGGDAPKKKEAPQGDGHSALLEAMRAYMEKNAETLERREVANEARITRLETQPPPAPGPTVIQNFVPAAEPPVVNNYVQPAAAPLVTNNVQVDAPTTIEKGAVQVAAPTTISAGAIQVSAPVDARTTIEPGAVSVEVKGGDKKITIKRDDEDQITGADVKAKG